MYVPSTLMLKAEFSIIDELVTKGLKRIETEQSVSLVKVNPKEDFTFTSSLADQISLKKSNTAEVPLYMARLLFEEGMAEPVDKFLDRKTLARISSEERYKEYRLTDVPPSFYSQLKYVLSSFRSEADERRASEIESLATEMVDLRLKKILRYCRLSSIPPELSASMTSEEAHLFNLLRHIIICWKKEVIGIGGK